MAVVEETETSELKIECRRSLHTHAVDACRAGWSIAEWEDWLKDHAVELVKTIGEREVQCIINVVWKKKRKRR